MRERQTFFSTWGLDGSTVRGPMLFFGKQLLPSLSDLSAEWFAWMLDELVAERDCYLIVERTAPPYGFVQFAVRSEGAVLAEAQSNVFRESFGPLTEDQEAWMCALGWKPPTCGWPEPQEEKFHSPNFYRQCEPSVPTGVAALLAVRTLRDIFGTIRVEELTFIFFRRRDDGAQEDDGFDLDAPLVL